MSLLAFIGDSDKSSQEKIINLLRTVKNLDEFRNINNSDLFSDPQRIYIIIDDLIIDIPKEDKAWEDIDIRNIKEYLASVPFCIGDKVVKICDKNNNHISEIVDLSINLCNNVIYKLNSPNSWALAEELSFATTLETVGYKCNHCGKILRSKKPHMCNGNYRCKKLSFTTPIQEDLGYIEIPEGYKFSHFEGNKIRLIKVI